MSIFFENFSLLDRKKDEIYFARKLLRFRPINYKSLHIPLHQNNKNCSFFSITTPSTNERFL